MYLSTLYFAVGYNSILGRINSEFEYKFNPIASRFVLGVFNV